MAEDGGSWASAGSPRGGEGLKGAHSLFCFSQDPFYGGGVPVLADAVVKVAASRGLPVSLVYFGAEQAVTPLKLALGRWHPRHHVRDGSPRTVQIATFPYLERLSVRLPRRVLAAEVARHTAHAAVLGHATSAAFLARSGVPYVLWVATTRSAEMAAQTGRWARLGERLVELANRRAEPWCRAEERLALHGARRVLVLTGRVRDDVLALGVEPERVSVLPPPLDLELFTPGAGGVEARREDAVCSVGRWDDPRKRADLLLDAVASVLRRRPALRVVLVGRHGPELQRAVRARGLQSAVTLTGFVSDEEKRGVLRRSAVFALSSAQEGFGIAVAEAMACGTAVVATRSGGPEELIRDGENGLLVEGSSEALAAGIEALLAAPDLRRRLAGAALVRVRRELAPERCEAALAEALCLDGPPGAGAPRVQS